MIFGAPRPGLRVCRAWARGAWLAAGLLALVAPGLAAAQEIATAQYEGPTTRYPHGVLGDDIEYTTLVVTLTDGRRLKARWDRPIVFEDLAPRLVDLDGDGRPEVITVQSHETKGASLQIWGLDEGRLAPIAATPHIGTRFRWLAPIGAADLDGDGHVEIAYIDRPHLAKTLRIWRFERLSSGAASLTEVAQQSGLSNHRIGWDYILGGVRDCGTGPELVTTDGAWARIMVTTLIKGGTQTRVLAPDPSRDRVAAALDCQF